MSRMLNLPWNKEQDTDSIEVPSEQARLTKQGILAKLAKIFYPLGLISQRHFVASSFITLFVIQREQHGKGLGKVCHKPLKYHDCLPFIKRRLSGLSYIPLEMPAQMELQPAFLLLIAKQQGQIKAWLLQGQDSKQGLTNLRPELIAGHMAVNLITNMREGLEGIPITSVHCCLDNSDALYWIRGQGKQK